MAEILFTNPVKVAIIGPDDRVEKTMRVAEDYPSLKLLPWIYQSEEETAELYQQAVQEVEIVLFMGPIPYYAVQTLEALHLPRLFIPLTGSSLMRALFQARINNTSWPTSISIDSLNHEIVEETFRDLGLADIKVYPKEFSGPITCQNLVNFHFELWRAGKSEVAFTCLRSAYYRLLEIGVPVYRVVATNSAIRESLSRVVIQGEQIRAKDMQIAVQICDIDQFEEISRRSSSEYAGERVRLTLQSILNDYAEQTWASVHFIGGDRFTIFTTRGILEKATADYQVDPLLEAVRKTLSATISVGTGLGLTAYHAEQNAYKALARAKAFGGDCSFIMTDDGRLVGPLGNDRRLESSLIQGHSDYLDLTQKTNLGIETLSRIASIQKLLGKETVDASELALILNVSTRSARRILKRLVQADLAELWAKEQATPTGRPRSLYRIRLGKEDSQN
ncbi:MAG: hypothetical protein A2029_10195 [Chloroflexi bacterium RBG_19FT_COMBO_47_9]|nr:MAG: hypothetical protein A2029_10195 [Chloroflexi bacterium RBG_19FT_COMBO_47_9]